MGGRTNPLLLKDDIGKAKNSCYDLPDGFFAFGRPGNQDLEGAREVSMHWVSHMPSRQQVEETPNFISHNKKALAAKATNARDLAQFRREGCTADYPSSARGPRHTPRDQIPSDVYCGFTYGRKIRPSTPIQEVITNRFAEQSERELSGAYTVLQAQRDASATQVRKIPVTRAAKGHASSANRSGTDWNDVGGGLFKMAKFKNVASKIQNRPFQSEFAGRERHGDAGGDFEKEYEVDARGDYEACGDPAAFFEDGDSGFRRDEYDM